MCVILELCKSCQSMVDFRQRWWFGWCWCWECKNRGWIGHFCSTSYSGYWLWNFMFRGQCEINDFELNPPVRVSSQNWGIFGVKSEQLSGGYLQRKVDKYSADLWKQSTQYLPKRRQSSDHQTSGYDIKVVCVQMSCFVSSKGALYVTMCH